MGYDENAKVILKNIDRVIQHFISMGYQVNKETWTENIIVQSYRSKHPLKAAIFGDKGKDKTRAVDCISIDVSW